MLFSTSGHTAVLFLVRSYARVANENDMLFEEGDCLKS